MRCHVCQGHHRLASGLHPSLVDAQTRVYAYSMPQVGQGEEYE